MARAGCARRATRTWTRTRRIPFMASRTLWASAVRRFPTFFLWGPWPVSGPVFWMFFYITSFFFPTTVVTRPPHSMPAFIPITFELAVLLGGSSSFFGLLIGLLKFPEPYHPLFELD